jgi:hypothetical protein
MDQFMIRNRHWYVDNRFFGLAHIILWVGLICCSTPAQQQPPSQPPQPRPDAKAELEKYREHRREMDARENDLKIAEKGAKEIDSNKESLTMRRLQDNFVRLQRVSSELTQTVKNDSTLDYSRVKDAAIEISKCAQRLKSDLVFPEFKSKKEKRDDSDDTDLKASSLRLEQLVKEFVSNTFLTKGVRDDELGIKASRDLDQIIELSGSIKKHSEKLSKLGLKH